MIGTHGVMILRMNEITKFNSTPNKNKYARSINSKRFTKLSQIELC